MAGTMQCVAGAMSECAWVSLSLPLVVHVSACVFSFSTCFKCPRINTVQFSSVSFVQLQFITSQLEALYTVMTLQNIGK